MSGVCDIVEPIGFSPPPTPPNSKKKEPLISQSRALDVAERTGLEPATSGVTGRHSNQLNYRSSGSGRKVIT